MLRKVSIYMEECIDLYRFWHMKMDLVLLRYQSFMTKENLENQNTDSPKSAIFQICLHFFFSHDMQKDLFIFLQLSDRSYFSLGLVFFYTYGLICRLSIIW